MINNIKKIEDLFKRESVSKIVVPPYQRAYSWEEKQLMEFINDIKEYAQKDKNYYLGHFIFEENKNNVLEVIDGQQRITTIILFLIICKHKLNTNEFDLYINKFETVNYDQENFNIIKEQIFKLNSNEEIKNFLEKKINEIKKNDNTTLSFKRIINALNYFYKEINELNNEDVGKLIKVIFSANISVYISQDKSFSNQVFEFQNTRGVKLSLLEKVKSKLMKEVYLNCDLDKTEQFIDKIQNNFAEIFKHEELIKSKSFRGELSLDHILRLHLRVIDDGSKINGNNNDKSKFYSPSISDNIEQSVLEYISKRLESFKDNKDKKIAYVDNLSTKFKESVCFFCEELVNIDKENPLIGDCLILERDISIEFYILLYHLNKKDLLKNRELVEKWERLLYTRDFHDRYYRVWYRDDFQELYLKICSNKDVIGCLNDYVQNGFRPDLMDNNNLQETVKKFVDDKKEDILKNAYNLWFSNKLIYLLYKYEIDNSGNKEEVRNQLREVIKSGYSREHILPQVGWEKFIEETIKDKNQIEKIKNSVKDVINGIGNLLIVTKNLNSENGNKHPSKKTYPPEWGISYKNHNDNQSEWNNPENWERIIEERGKKIFEYLRENLLRDLNLKN